jgi:hypothetical protein
MIIRKAMASTEKRIIASYAKLFESLSFRGKLELLERLAKSLKKEDAPKSDSFFTTFGAWGSNKSAEEIIAEIMSRRKFNDREVSL